MLITSSRNISEWGTVFGDAVVAAAILDRLLHHTHGLKIDAAPRLAGCLRSGLAVPPPPRQTHTVSGQPGVSSSCRQEQLAKPEAVMLGIAVSYVALAQLANERDRGRRRD